MSFLVGLWFGSYVRYIPFSIVSILVLCALGLTWCERQGRVASKRSLILYACLLCGVGYWNVGEWQNSESALLQKAGEQEVLLSGVIADPVQHAPGRMTMLVDVMSIGEEAKKRVVQGKLRLTWRNPNTAVYRGDAITVRTRPGAVWYAQSWRI